MRTILNIFSKENLCGNQVVNEKKPDILKRFRNHFIIPTAISENVEFKTFIDGLSNFSGNSIDADKETILIGKVEKRRGLDTLFYKLFVLSVFNGNYKITFLPENGANERISFSVITEHSEKIPERLITAVEKFSSENDIVVDYYLTAIYGTKSQWVGKDVMQFYAPTNSYNHCVVIKDDENRVFKIQNFDSKDRLIDLSSINGFEIRGETIFNKEGHELSQNDILHIFKTVKEFKQFKERKHNAEQNL